MADDLYYADNSDFTDNSQAGIDYLQNNDFSNYGTYSLESDGSYGGGGGTNYAGALGSIFKGLGGAQGISQLAGGAYGTYAAQQQSKAQAQQAQELLKNADPYLQYRQQAEIPFMLGQMGQYADVQNAQNNLLGQISSKAGTVNPELNAMRTRMTALDNKYGAQFDNYNGMLDQSYKDPMSVYNSDAYQGLAEMFGEKIARRDAAKGRLSQYGDRAVEMQGNFLDHLDKYRSGLSGTTLGMGQLQNQAYGTGIQGIVSQQNADTQNLGTLSQLYGGMTNNLNHLGGLITPRGTAGNGATQAATMGSDAAAYGNYALNPAISGLIKSFGG